MVFAGEHGDLWTRALGEIQRLGQVTCTKGKSHVNDRVAWLEHDMAVEGFVANEVSLWYTPVEDQSTASWREVARVRMEGVDSG